MSLFDPTAFRDLVSGKRRGVLPAVTRCALAMGEIPYSLVVARRNRRFDNGKTEIHRVGVPVISVGNITMGGTGKTPVVEWLARWFRARGVRVCIISRGYGAEEGARNDEALELEQKLPDVPHVQNPNRVEAAQMAIEEFETQLILLDDAFQHRRIHRDLNIVLLDALEPFGFEHVFPRGTLREPLAGLARADVVCLTRADMLSPDERLKIRARVQQYRPNVSWVELSHAPRALLKWRGEEQPLATLREKKTAAFCGIGNPAGFRHTLETCGYTVAGWQEFPDHHNYSRGDIEALIAWASELQATDGASAIVCTHKDLVKIQSAALGPLPLLAVAIGMEVLAGQSAFEAELQRIPAVINAASF